VPSEEELGPLPSGRHGFTREQVAAHQRERIVAGLAEAVAERGYNAVTITQIAKSARVSKRAFYEQFESKDECFLAAFEIVVFHLRELIEDEIEPIPDWPHRVVAGLGALLDFIAADPALARLCLVDSITAGPAVAERFREQIDVFVPLLQPGRAERDNPRPLPDSTEETLIGALVSMLSRSLAFGDVASLRGLLPDFVEFVLMPYVGPTEAHRLAEESSEHS
jgi:AcrR family transcriptional regulator